MRKVGLVQINNSFSGQNYFPYSIGILQAYCEKYLTKPYEFLLPIYNRIPVQSACEKLRDAQIVFFSCYVWNIKISLEIARRIKTPDVLIVMGGPQIPDRPEEFLRMHEFVDIVCRGEGEQAMLGLLENLDNWSAVPSISYIKDGVCVNNPKAERVKDMSLIPSPYLSGTFNRLIEAYPNERWIVMWETNRGCPFSCTFCDWGSATQSKVFQFDMDRIYKEIDWFATNKIDFIFCADANFGILPRDLDIVNKVVHTRNMYGYPNALSVQNTKNATERAYQVQKTLAVAGLNKGVTVSFQSLDTMTLESIKRANISTKSFQELQRRFTKDKIETYTDLILGLPGETYESFKEGVSQTIENGQHNRIQFNNLSILPNAEMGDPEYQKKFGMEIVETEVVNIHGMLKEEEIVETQQLVVATHSTPREDWVKTRAFSWLAAFLHFDKIFQIPLVCLHETKGTSYKDLIEKFAILDYENYPVISEIYSFFVNKAKDIQNGGVEYCHHPEWLNIYWPADEWMFIHLSMRDGLESFYEEAHRLIWGNDPLVADAIYLNRSLVKQPFKDTDVQFMVRHNVLEFYKSVLEGDKIQIVKKKHIHTLRHSIENWSSWEEWMREVVWWGNKKGAYLYGCESETQLSGHF